ncbi:MAG: TPM domain-containing protein, partial [Saprospiraceae bacterium]
MKLFTAEEARRLALSICTVLLLAQGGSAQSGIFPEKPDPVVLVHDYSGWLTEQEKFLLEDKLQRYRDSTSTEIVTIIRPDIGDYDRSSYAIELGNQWGIGKKSKNNGVVVLIVTEQPSRGVFIATGYGTEGALPDITAGRIIRNTMIPFFKQGQNYQGIDAGLTDIMRALAGEFKADETDNGKFPAWIFLAIAMFILIVIVVVAVLANRNGSVYGGTGPVRRYKNSDDWWGGGWGGGSS